MSLVTSARGSVSQLIPDLRGLARDFTKDPGESWMDWIITASIAAGTIVSLGFLLSALFALTDISYAQQVHDFILTQTVPVPVMGGEALVFPYLIATTSFLLIPLVLAVWHGFVKPQKVNLIDDSITIFVYNVLAYIVFNIARGNALEEYILPAMVTAVMVYALLAIVDIVLWRRQSSSRSEITPE